jgi:hypothetical protein
MSDRRDLVLGLAVLAAAPLVASGRAEAAPVGESAALAALLPWIQAVAEGDRDAVGRLLAPEFQILRSDGTGYDKAGYLAALPQHRRMPEVRDVQAQGDGDLLVIRYAINADQIVRGQAMHGTAPRLSTLRHEGEAWLMVAHANFARING